MRSSEEELDQRNRLVDHAENSVGPLGPDEVGRVLALRQVRDMHLGQPAASDREPAGNALLVCTARLSNWTGELLGALAGHRRLPGGVGVEAEHDADVAEPRARSPSCGPR